MTKGTTTAKLQLVRGKKSVGVQEGHSTFIRALPAGTRAIENVQENVMLYGMTFQVPTGMGYTNTINLTLYVDSPRALYLKDKLETMMEEHGQLSKNTGTAKKGKIPTNSIYLDLLKPDSMNPTDAAKRYTLVGVYPTSVGNVGLTHTGSALSTIPVIFSYQYYFDNAKNDAIKNSQK